MIKKWRIALTSILAIGLLGLGGVWAAEATRAVDGRCAMGRGHKNSVMGKITAISGDQITVQPELPAWVSSKLAEKGMAAPELPASVTFVVDGNTKAFKNSTQASASDFAVGDAIAARLDGDPASGTPHAKRLADDATVQSFIGKVKQHRKERIARDGRPVLGTITAIEGQTVTIKPELPQFISERLAQSGKTAPQRPDSLSFIVADDAQVMKANAAAQLTDFAVGDSVAAMVKGDVKSGAGSAVKFMDAATARELIQQKAGEWRNKRQQRSAGADQASFESVAPQNGLILAANRGDGEGSQRDRGEGKGQRQRGGGRGERGPGEHRGAHPAYGTITAIEGNTITIAPRRPEWAKEPPRGEGGPGGGAEGQGRGEGRGQREGRERPPMPESLTFTVNAETKFGVNGEKGGSLSDFKVGDTIGVRLTGDIRNGEGVALAVVDGMTAKKLFEKMGPGGAGGPGGRGMRGEGGPGGPDGQGGPGRGPRPMFGVITSVDANTITIKPEVPEFVKQHMEQRGQRGPGGERGPGEGRGPRGDGGPGGQGGPDGQRGPGGEGRPGGPGMPRELPAQLTVSLGGETHYFQNNTEVDRNPYQEGDRVAIMLTPDSRPEDATAHAVMDYSTFEAKAKQMRDGAEGKQGKGKAGKGKNKGNKAGKGRSKDGQGKQRQGQNA